jgi:hypothetical protein
MICCCHSRVRFLCGWVDGLMVGFLKVFVEGTRGEHSIAEVGHLDLVIKNRRLDIECSSKDGEMVESHRIKDVGNVRTRTIQHA